MKYAVTFKRRNGGRTTRQYATLRAAEAAFNNKKNRPARLFKLEDSRR